ncbi:phosphoribosylformylglycinamidine synthase [Ruminococcus sp.]|uniref:phosphoribosylformylglycinamidine synthase n=1 Tax=Ruminococcus sp. TaxID=41978 RepID=UPI002C841DF3|nr:phosphoribosylformylglycinamidine synthase [Ruminococcus sp.]HOA00172.1 phosphoribosylformylglycinamidine synthase [Ruminococcus sp.]HOH85972.1 phosphoribosylformylglycinamidine synthase [Ruminococcus sp.]
MSVFRIYVEKKPEFAVEAQSVLSDIKTALRLNISGVRILNRYDADKLSEEDFNAAIGTVFSEPAVDVVYDELPQVAETDRVFAVEYLPGQFNQRADSCEQCIQILRQGERCRVRNARVYIISGVISDDDFAKLKAYIINPVESREASLETVKTLDTNYDIPTTVEELEGFINLNAFGLHAFVDKFGLAMDYDDIKFCQDYFRNEEKRNPTITEIRMIDTYWSDHCRHTTFLTNVENVKIDTPYIKDTYDMYVNVREELGRTDKPMTLMDLATLAAKKLKADGKLPDLDESEEINACSVKIKVDIDGEQEDWILMFKNETHNHPTEIEPFGGAATCLGGAIRDPLSGRSYVYQAMRVTGAANPLVPVEDTIAGKLPQRKITVGAANGYSSYGNQIGLATGHVAEVYHPGYVAKRMEIGAVLGAAPAENIRRERPVPGDIVILLGGKTGRDGCGGATGSSKSHTLESLESCGAEVQKGNPPEERKLQRLFRNPEVTKMIKRCNDFGAGGVSVAIGELTDGLVINLNAVPKKYDGLDGTEIAISESQERMAVVIAPEDLDKFMEEAAKENLEATLVADVVEEPRLKMNWNGNTIVDLSREFLNSNGAPKYTDIEIERPAFSSETVPADSAETWSQLMSNLNVCSQKGLIEKFDSTIGAGTVLMPFGGVYQMTPSQAMAAKIPVLKGETNTCSLMGWGYNPDISEKSPYHGAMLAVIESIAKVVAAGGSYKKCWLTFQEYFERTQNDPTRWGKPMAALLGAFKAQLELECGSIGGKDSMSGTFENIDVPPTLVSFAVSTAIADKIVSTEFKESGSTVITIVPEYDEHGLPKFDSIRDCFDKVEKIIADGRANAIWTNGYGGFAEGIAKMCFGNKIGFEFTSQPSAEMLFKPCYGAFIIELKGEAKSGEEVLGKTIKDYKVICRDYTLSLDNLQRIWEGKLEPVFPCRIKTTDTTPQTYSSPNRIQLSASTKIAKPRVLIPVFPGTNCEYDTARAFEKAGAKPEVVVIRNLSAGDIEESVSYFERAVRRSEIIMIPGGFSGGDEPEGSGKFITAFFRNPKIKDAVHNLLRNRDGLMLGICNGFQALIKLGLVPYGEIIDMADDAPTLTFNTINRHQSMMVNTRIASNKSPWLYGCEVGDIHTVPISHGEGRFVAPASLIQQLAKNGQIATQYVDLDGNPTMDIRYNPNTSIEAIEGITSPDGRVFGKMGHSERKGSYICKNVQGEKDQKIFESGVKYFT